MTTFDVTTDYADADFFTDPSLIPDPYPYFDYLRAQAPALAGGPGGTVVITGHAEALAVYKDPAMSSCNAVVGPFAPLPFEATGDDITDLIAEHRAGIPMADHVVTMDPPEHARIRGLLSRLITPKRLAENEEFMWRLADRQLDELAGRSSCEFIEEYAKPFSLLVIADLLGVPAEDHDEFRLVFASSLVGELDGELEHNPLVWLDEKFTTYISDRRRDPCGDVLTSLAQATFEDGSMPTVDEVVKLATFVFAAGQETTVKLLSAAMRVLGERPDIQELLRADRSHIPVFLEETLRLESPVKSHFRMAAKSTAIGQTPIPAGTTVMLLPGACNRDPRKFEQPNEFRMDRPNVREHVAFGRGLHSCLGAPLARSEARISMNRILDRMTDIAVDESFHGPAGHWRYEYEPTFIMRGMTQLHVTFAASPSTA
jgi:cytochrome P450